MTQFRSGVRSVVRPVDRVHRERLKMEVHFQIRYMCTFLLVLQERPLGQRPDIERGVKCLAPVRDHSVAE